MTRRAGPVTEISGFACKNSVIGMKLFPYEHTTKFVPVSEPAQLPGSYEEALNEGVTGIGLR